MSLRILALAAALSFAVPTLAETTDPMRFFEGRTESVGRVKLVMHKSFQSRAVGDGKIMPDGSLHLVQRVEEQGKRPIQRQWHMRLVAPGRYLGTMSEAKGPVTVEEVNGRYRFQFRMDGGVSVEQWLTPAADGRSASSKITFRKYGIVVGRSEAIIRKLE
jgi:hypothetical protein